MSRKAGTVPEQTPGSGRPGRRGSAERRSALLDHLTEHEDVLVSELPALLGVSVETVRRDLRALEDTHAITRSYGRVRAAESGSYESSREFRLSHLPDEKQRIAEAAVARLGSARTVFLDEGFHPLLVGRALPTDRNLTIITACLPTAIEMSERPRTTVVVIGGRVRQVTLGAVERWATAMLREMQPDLAVVGANGVGLDGWMTTPHPSVAEVKSTVLEVAQRSLFVGSHTKFGVSTLSRFGHVRDVERVITGRELRTTTAQRLEAAGARMERV